MCSGANIEKLAEDVFDLFGKLPFVEVIMEAELNELKHYLYVRFKGLKGRQLTELKECRTLMTKFVIIEKTMIGCVNM